MIILRFPKKVEKGKVEKCQQFCSAVKRKIETFWISAGETFARMRHVPRASWWEKTGGRKGAELEGVLGENIVRTRVSLDT